MTNFTRRSFFASLAGLPVAASAQSFLQPDPLGYRMTDLMRADEQLRAENFMEFPSPIVAAQQWRGDQSPRRAQGDRAAMIDTVDIFQFGASPTNSPSANRVAIQQALDSQAMNVVRDEYASSARVIIPATDRPILCEPGLIVRRNIIIEGSHPNGRGLGAARLIFSDGPAGSAAIFFRSPGGLSAPSPYATEIGAGAYGAGRSIIRNLYIAPENPGMVDFGIVHNIPVTLDHVSVQDFRRAGFFAHGQSSGDSGFGDPDGTGGSGTMYGNTNQSMYHKCVARDTTEGHGFVAQGNNTQIMTYLACDASGNKGCGFRDNSAIGNHYIGCHSAQNSYKVLHAGAYYIPIKPHTAAAISEPGVGAKWREFWIQVVASAEDAQWAVGEAYRDAGGINIVDTSGPAPMILGHYTEGGIEYGVVPRAGAFVAGGVAVGFNRVYRDGPDATGITVVGAARASTPPTWSYTDPSGEAWGAGLGSSAKVAAFFRCGHTDDDDVNAATPQKNGLTLQYSKVRHAYEFLKGAATALFSITANGWSVAPYSGKGMIYFPAGVVVGGPKAARIRAAFSIASIPAGLAVQKGELFLLTGSGLGGPAFAYVRTGGTVGSGAVVDPVGKIGEAL